jgi:hypothetical protein
MPYYLDIELRKLLLRYFAEIWLPRDRLPEIFKMDIEGSAI